MRKSRLSESKQQRLIELFISGSTARTAAALIGVNKNTAAYYFHRLRQLVYQAVEDETLFSGEIEVDESTSVADAKVSVAEVLLGKSQYSAF